jgi:small subunit ribosomal protein S7
MPRAGKVPKRNVQPDVLYGSRLISKLINRVMKDGEKSVAQKQIYKALEIIKQKSGDDPLQLTTKAIENIKPQMEVRPRRIGGAAYQVPQQVRGDRKESLAIRWLVLAAKARPPKEYHSFAEKLAAELLDAASEQGAAIKKKLDMHRMAEANKAFSHFRW